MKLTSEQWKKGIANSHYTGVANLRNVRIDDEGVLRVMNRPQNLISTTSSITDIQKDYFETNFNWYAVIGEDVSNNSGGIYSSKTDTYRYSGNGTKYSGGVVYRNVFIPFPAIPNTDAGYMEDTDQNGSFDVLSDSFEVLVTKGQVQTRLDKQLTRKAGKSSAILTSSVHVLENLNQDGFKVFDGETEIASVTVANPRAIVRVEDTKFVVVFSDRLELYNTSGTLLHTLAFDFTRGDSIQHLEGAEYTGGRIATLTHTRDIDNSLDFLELRTFQISSDIISTDKNKTVLIDTDLIDEPHIAVMGEDIVVLYNEFSPVLQVYESTNLNISSVFTSMVTLADYGPIAGYGDSFIMFGNRTTQFNWNDVAKEITIGDTDIIAPKDIDIVSVSGDYFGLSENNGFFNLYKINIGQIDKTHVLIGLDDVIYYSNGNYIGSITENAGQTFDPSDNTTYTKNTEALDLPAGVKITALANYGEFIAIGTQGGYIYFWDRTSQSFRVPVNIGEPIASLKSKNNLLYAVSQDAGNVYIANLSSFERVKNLTSLSATRFNCDVAGMEFFDDGTFIGATLIGENDYSGIWIYRNGAWSLVSTESAVNAIGKSSPSEIVYTTNDGVYVIDMSGSPIANWNDDEAYIYTPMEMVGTVTNKAHESKYEIYFDKPFSANEYVKLYYRTTTYGDWQHIQTVTSEQLVADSGLFAFKGQLSTPKAIQLQYKIVLNTTAGMVLFETK